MPPATSNKPSPSKQIKPKPATAPAQAQRKTSTVSKPSKTGTTGRLKNATTKRSREERKKIARDRWRHAIRKVCAMIRFGLPIRIKPIEELFPVQTNLAPTYKMKPDPGKKFNSTVVKHAIEELLEARLKDYQYSRFTAPKLCKLLATVLTDRVKEMGFPRYRFVVSVVIGENSGQQ